MTNKLSNKVRNAGLNQKFAIDQYFETTDEEKTKVVTETLKCFNATCKECGHTVAIHGPRYNDVHAASNILYTLKRHWAQHHCKHSNTKYILKHDTDEYGTSGIMIQEYCEECQSIIKSTDTFNRKSDDDDPETFENNLVDNPDFIEKFIKLVEDYKCFYAE